MTDYELAEKIMAMVCQVRDNRKLPIDIVPEIFDLYKQANYVQLDPDQRLPEIPEFQYDPEEYRPYLKRGAINYSKLLTGFKKVR